MQLALKEAAARYNLSASHLRLLCRAGVLASEKIGRDWFLSGDETVIKGQLDSRPRRGKYSRPKRRTTAERKRKELA